jgi:hypothetical protein
LLGFRKAPSLSKGPTDFALRDIVVSSLPLSSRI